MNKKKRLIPIIALVLFICIVIACVVAIQYATRHNMTYEEYNALSAEEQQEYFNSFDNIDDFFAWYNQAKKEYEDAQDRIEINGSSDINIGGIGGN